MTTRDVVLRTDDGIDLSARLFTPDGTDLRPKPGATIVILGATAAPQRYYAAFARFLASRGHNVITFDYRGIGASRPRSLRGYRARMFDWGRYDIEAALRFASARFPSTPLLVVGHSFGGQGLGLAPSAPELVTAAALIGSQSGDLRHWPWKRRLRHALFFAGVVPLTTSVLGYCPAWTGIGGDLPGGVAREWAQWCFTPGYLEGRLPPSMRYHKAFEGPLLVVSIEDDDFAPEPAVEALAGWYRSASIERWRLGPSDVRGRPLGHFGFFREALAGHLWANLARTLEDHAPRGSTAKQAAVRLPAA